MGHSRRRRLLVESCERKTRKKRREMGDAHELDRGQTGVEFGNGTLGRVSQSRAQTFESFDPNVAFVSRILMNRCRTSCDIFSLTSFTSSHKTRSPASFQAQFSLKQKQEYWHQHSTSRNNITLTRGNDYYRGDDSGSDYSAGGGADTRRSDYSA